MHRNHAQLPTEPSIVIADNRKPVSKAFAATFRIENSCHLHFIQVTVCEKVEVRQRKREGVGSRVAEER